MRLTRQQYDNLWIAYLRWQEVDPATVDLHYWNCGTFACFGGHCAVMPEFKAQGLRLFERPPGHAGIKLGGDEMGWWYGMDTASVLFGDSMLFNSRGGCASDIGASSDWHAVLLRLENAIIQAEVVG